MAEAVDPYAVLTSVSAVVAGGATVVWVLRSARPPAPVPTGRAPKVPGGLLEVGGLVGLLTAAGLLLALGGLGPARPIEQTAALALLVATVLRVYRLNSAGPVAVDRLAAALALVAATALLTGGALVVMLAPGSIDAWLLQWWGGYLVAGAGALAVGLRWRHLAVITQSKISATH
jgi:hypothetical protein